MKVTVANPQAMRYVHKDPNIPPFTEYEVKVKAFNSQGEGPFSLTAPIYSAQDGKHCRDSLLLMLKSRKEMSQSDPKTMSQISLNHRE